MAVRMLFKPDAVLRSRYALLSPIFLLYLPPSSLRQRLVKALENFQAFSHGINSVLDTKEMAGLYPLRLALLFLRARRRAVVGTNRRTSADDYRRTRSTRRELGSDRSRLRRFRSTEGGRQTRFRTWEGMEWVRRVRN